MGLNKTSGIFGGDVAPSALLYLKSDDPRSDGRGYPMTVLRTSRGLGILP